MFHIILCFVGWATKIFPQTMVGDIPSPRYRHATAALSENQVLVYGGRGAMGRLEPGDSYHGTVDTEHDLVHWHRLPNATAFSARHSHALIQLKVRGAQLAMVGCAQCKD